MAPSNVSVVLPTCNSERDIGPCLAALANQFDRRFEVIVIDAASTDSTVALVREAQRVLPVPLRLAISPRRIPVGEARNCGVLLAQSPNVAFLSPDAQADPHWTEELIRSLEKTDMVFGRRVHTPRTWTTAAAVRGLRSDFPNVVPPDPLPYASSTSSAYLKDVLVAMPFDPRSTAAEDRLHARRASAAGYRAAYNPHAVVRHQEVPAFQDELRQTIREGQTLGAYWQDIGLYVPVLVWGLLLGLASALFVARSTWWTVLLLLLVLWTPATRRVVRHFDDIPPIQILKGFGAGPLFDLVFLANYVRGLVRADGPRRERRPRAPQLGRPVPRPAETHA